MAEWRRLAWNESSGSSSGTEHSRGGGPHSVSLLYAGMSPFRPNPEGEQQTSFDA